MMKIEIIIFIEMDSRYGPIVADNVEIWQQMHQMWS